MKTLMKIVFIAIIITLIKTSRLNEYAGQNFPSKYLSVQSELPTARDLDNYMKHLKIIIEYFSRYLNETEGNIAVSMFFTKTVLKRTLMESRDKLQPYQLADISKSINAAEHILSYYYYMHAPYAYPDVSYAVSKLIQYGDLMVYTIGDFNKKRLHKWILKKEDIHTFIEDLDTCSLPKEKFTDHSEGEREGYYITISNSDTCLGQIILEPEPINASNMHACKRDFCYENLVSNPSIGYSLSHRTLNLLFRFFVRRCYLDSEEADMALLDRLCAAQYREVVYLARRGFFARDLFMEHIALCAVLGYEEFHRTNWFNKAASWINKDNCIREDNNYDLNRTSILLKKAADNPKRTKFLRKWRCERKFTFCDDHPTAMVSMIMAHAIRHAAYFMATP